MPSVGVIGSGTMGAGIAQVAAQRGWDVQLKDVRLDVASKAVTGIEARFGRLVEKGRMTSTERDAAVKRLHATDDPASFGDCELVVEAVLEDLELKSQVLMEAARHIRPNAVLATNTSSLSVAKLAYAIGAPDRLVGMHFFNPVPLMPLVEVISTEHSAPTASERVFEIAKSWGKTAVRCKDTPGFIVNRVARGYYLEPLRMLGEGVASVDELDATLVSLGGFRMGPFTLMDLIGIDVNYTVSCSVWEQLGRPARLTPHPIQESLYKAGHFGRKAGRGAYLHESDPPIPAVTFDRRSFEMDEGLREAVRLFATSATEVEGSLTQQYILARTLGAIINEAGLALDAQVASPEDIDTAMRLGTNYPRGPVEWAQQVGLRTCRHVLDLLNAGVPDGRFSSAEWLRQ